VIKEAIFSRTISPESGMKTVIDSKSKKNKWSSFVIGTEWMTQSFDRNFRDRNKFKEKSRSSKF
jgi:hypothetical protein